MLQANGAADGDKNIRLVGCDLKEITGTECTLS